MDIFTREKRANIMRGVKAKDTKPELVVRRFLHANGYRYRIHKKGLPGKPDIAFIGRKKAIFIHGCFWHQHVSETCTISRRPESNTAFWNAKLDRNVERDAEAERKLREAGWDVLIVWECQIRHVEQLHALLKAFLGPTRQEKPHRH